MNVELPDGTVVEGIPEGTSRAALAAKLQANGMTVPKEWLQIATGVSKEVKEVGMVESALRTAGDAARPAVRMFDMAAAGLAGLFGDAKGQEEVFQGMQARQQGMKEAYAPKPDEEFSTTGKVLGGVASMPTAMLGQGVAPGIARASEVVEAGGSLGEAGKAGAVSGAVNQALQMLPMHAGAKVIEKVGGGAARKIAAGALTGAAINVPAGIAGRAAENAALPEGESFEHLQNPALSTESLAMDAGMSAAFGALGARGMLKAQAKSAKAKTDAAPPEFPSDKFTDLGDGDFRAPNGATVTKEAWETSSPKIRDGWMKEAPAEEKLPVGETKEVGVGETADTAEIDRLKEQHPSGPVAEVAEQVRKEKQKQAEAAAATRKAQADAAELRRAAGTTSDPDLQTALRKQADKLDPPNKVPAGEVKEGQPEIKVDAPKEIPVGKVVEGQPEIQTEVPSKPLATGEAKELYVDPERFDPKAKLPVGEATEIEPLPVGEVKEYPPGGTRVDAPLPVGEVKELPRQPDAFDDAPTLPVGEAKVLPRGDLTGRAPAAEKPLPVGEAKEITQSGVTPVAKVEPIPAGDAREVFVDPKRAESDKSLDLGLPKIDEVFMKEMEQATARTVSKARSTPGAADRGRRQVRAALEKGAADGTLDKDSASLATWALDKNPNLAAGLKLRVSGESPVPGARGSYDSANRVVELFKANKETAVHEILHHSERMMPAKVQLGVRREWRRHLEALAKKATPEMRKILSDIPRAMGDDAAARDRVRDAVRAGKLEYHLYDPSEFWAVNASRILSSRHAGRNSWRAQAKQWIKEMVEHVKGTVGLRSDSPVLKALGDIMDAKTTTGVDRSPAMLKRTEAATGEPLSLDAYGKAPKNLMGFRKSKPNAEFKDQNHKHVEFVRLKWPDGRTMLEAQRGLNKPHALERARRNWSGAKIEAVSRDVVAKEDASLIKEVDDAMGAKSMDLGPDAKTYTHIVVDPRNGKEVGEYQTAAAARRGRDRFDDAYGGYRYKVQELKEPRVRAVKAKAPQTNDESFDLSPSAKRTLPEESKADVVERKLFDRFNRVLKLQKVEPPKSEAGDIYQADQLYSGRVQARGDKLETEFVKPLGKALEAAKKAGVTVRDADDYLMALHAPERNKVIAARNPKIKDGGSGLTDQQAKDIVAGFTPEQRKHLDAIAKQVHAMNKQKLDNLVEDGLVKPEVRDQLNAQYKNYVPLKTLDAEAEFTGVGRGYELSGKDIVASMGRASKASSPIAASVMDASRSILRGEKARVDRTVWDYAQDKGAQDFVKPYDPENPPPQVMSRKFGPDGQVKEIVDTQKVQDLTISLMVNGEQQRVFIPDELLRDQLRKVATGNDPGPVLAAIGRGTGMVGRMLTEFNPAFTLPNAVKDAITVAMRAGAHQGLSTAKVMAGIPAAWKTIIDHKRGASTPEAKLYEEFVKTGGKTGAYGIQGVADTMRSLEKVGADLGYDEHKGGYGRKVKNALGSVAKVVSSANEVLEYASRFSVYKQAREAGYSPTKAASVAKEITVNFNRSGEYSRTMNSVLVFANAALQGLRNTVVYGKNKNVQKGMLGMVALGAAVQAYNEQVGGDNEETGEKNINSQNDAAADKSVVLLSPGSRKGVKIPLPPEYAGLFAIGRRAYRAFSQGDVKKEAAGIVGNVLDMTLPVRVGDADSGALAVAKSVTPTLLSPFADIFTNQNYFGMPIVPELRDKMSPAPYFTQSRANTSELAKSMSEMVNTATGGDSVRPGLSQKALGPLIAPEGIEHLVGFFAGGAGALAMQSKNIVKNANEGKPQDTNKLPIVNRFAFDEPKSYTSRRYKELQADFEYAKDYRKAGQDEKIAPKVLAALAEYEATERELRSMFKELREAGAAGESREPIQERIKQAQARVIKAYNQAAEK